MTLNLDNHLLQAEDALVTTLLGKLLFRVVSGAISVFLGSILGLIRNISRSLVTKLRGACCAGLVRVDAITSIALVGSVLGYTFNVVLVERLVLVEGSLCLAPQIVTREIGNIVPRIVVRSLINLGQLILGGVDPVGSVLRCITSNVTEKNGGITD